MKLKRVFQQKGAATYEDKSFRLRVVVSRRKGNSGWCVSGSTPKWNRISPGCGFKTRKEALKAFEKEAKKYLE